MHMYKIDLHFARRGSKVFRKMIRIDCGAFMRQNFECSIGRCVENVLQIEIILRQMSFAKN